jgi:glycosyltransferase involved in cell wall biosynthesis
MKRLQFEKGISVIICCFNSKTRIAPTLTNLSKQVFSNKMEWEIILVDNASTDSTGSIASFIWESFNTGISFRVVQETKPGLTYAREKGIAQAKYKYVLFCDDDNWLSENYLETAFTTMEKDPRLAACGGLGNPLFEIPEPIWFHRFTEAFAVGPQDISIENNRLLCLYGAGLVLRQSAYCDLKEKGFTPLMTDRKGNQLSSSGDTELTNALVLIGYKLEYVPKMVFHHFLPHGRLRAEYLLRLYKSFGKDGPLRNLYYAHLTNRRAHQHIKNWWVHLGLAVFRMVKYLIHPPKKNARAIYFAWSCSYLRELLRLKKSYQKICRQIQDLNSQVNSGTETSRAISLLVPATKHEISGL